MSESMGKEMDWHQERPIVSVFLMAANGRFKNRFILCKATMAASMVFKDESEVIFINFLLDAMVGRYPSNILNRKYL